jgi:hypothetical protein
MHHHHQLDIGAYLLCGCNSSKGKAIWKHSLSLGVLLLQIEAPLINASA